MSRSLLPFIIATSFIAACGDSYDGPGKNLVRRWDVTSNHYEATIGGQTSSQDSLGGTIDIYPDGEYLMVEDGDCAFPGLGDGDDRLTLTASDSCVRNANGDLFTHGVEAGSAVQTGGHLTIQISGWLQALTGGAQGTFTLTYLGVPDTGSGCAEGDPCSD